MIYPIIFFVLLILLLSCLGLLFQALSQLVIARAENRIGPNHHRFSGVLQPFIDQLKLSRKKVPTQQLPIVYRILRILDFLLPYLFAFILLNPFTENFYKVNRLTTLILLLFIYLSISLLTQFEKEEIRFKLKYRREHLMSLLGVTIFFFSLVTVLIIVGDDSLVSFNNIQKDFPYFLLLSSPFALLSGLTSLLSIVMILKMKPFYFVRSSYRAGYWHALELLVKNVWLISLLIMWSIVFLGGGANSMFHPISFIFLFVKVIVVFFLWACLENSISILRYKDALEFGLVRVLPIAIIAIIGELAWVALVKLWI